MIANMVLKEREREEEKRIIRKIIRLVHFQKKKRVQVREMLLTVL